MTFREIEAEDVDWARALLEAGGRRSCEFAFVNVYMWSRVYHSKIARFEDFVIARSEGKRLHYLYPEGRGERREAVRAILADAAEDGRVPLLFSLTHEDAAELEAWYPGKFRYEMLTRETDYIYLTSELAELPGKKFQKKRNHCAHFEREYEGWVFREIMEADIPAVKEFNNLWCERHDTRGGESVEEEHRAIELALLFYDELGLKGGMIEVGGTIAAFSFGSALGPDMFVTHVEKALYDMPGAYSMINREMARNFCAPYRYINRENDLDEEGLRRAKLSYHPVMLEEKYIAEWISS